jgi:hypothetical protein
VGGQDVQNLSELWTLEHLAHLWCEGLHIGVHGDELLHDGRIRHHGGHLLEELWVVEQGLHLVDVRERFKRWKKGSDHVWIVWIETHFRERVQTGHGTESAVRVELSQGIGGILAGLHGWELLWG